MERLGARRERMRAAVGPCIGQAAYEVGPEFEQDFLRQRRDNARFFSRESQLVRARISICPPTPSTACGRRGVGQRSSDCRRALVHRAMISSAIVVAAAERQPDYGRQISAIVLT